MAIDKLALIKEVRERTNGGMIDVKKSLEESNWDVEKAIVWLKSNGKIKAAKKADRISAEGLLAVSKNEKLAVLVEVNCETDFVVKNEQFKNSVQTIANSLLAANVRKETNLDSIKINDLTLNEYIDQLTATIGEKISLRRYEILEAGENEFLGAFSHINGQIAAIVKISKNDEELAKNIAMHAAAMKPEYIFVEDVPKEKLEALKAEINIPAGFEKKPANIQEQILQGALNKKLSEIVLVKQVFMIDDSKTIEQLLESKKAKLLTAFRYAVGEGIEKVVVDFASEAISQIKK
ncbi:Translation elongation factor Ts [Mycoplasmopsis meleagridis]|uniref:Elongation factor Ts n=1 Tax=Mycoplasmopsis meleagridis ATCC 25294 TaxID=1264554 RepID=A0A0F5H0S0_9BACT|nr:translation elongation factor Ts [Mycoplasmopsis meleagridis]KKB26874.1 Translation elongation factor Ts [Mycoplasmopsis meleagridis ATCC 25294]OAD18297.1 Translation elongation factor Ts [Mycoplasmopsis meleagridis]VEU77530.1 Elongation factor Ts [Mycoplasmopsis meleagridis]